MEERIKKLLGRVMEWWKKFTNKQRTIIIALAATVIVAMVIMVAILNRTQYETIRVCETTAEASEIKTMLVEEGIPVTVSKDGLTIKVDVGRVSDANLLLGANGFSVVGYSIDNVTSGGFSTTEADKQKKYVVYLESQLELDIMTLDAIKSANVMLNIPSSTGTLIEQKQDSSAMVILELKDEFSTDQAAYLAKAVATALGNDTTKNITIMDTQSNLLYSGDDTYSVTGNATSQLSVMQQVENAKKSQVKEILLGTNLYDNISVAANVVVDFSESYEASHEYDAPDGKEQGMLSHEELYNSENESGAGGVPGTSSNDDNGTYVWDDGEKASSSVEEIIRDYLPNEYMKETTHYPGRVIYADSSVSVTAIAYNVIHEKEAKKAGLLNGMSWEEYKMANNERIKLEVDPELYSVVANSTGFPEDKITIMAYSENCFIDKEGLNITAKDVVQVVLIILILGLLAYVVVRSMMAEKTRVVEEEISVEDLLQSTPDLELQNVDIESKSEARRMIEKFVDDNPEAVAGLLKTWINQEWGA